MSREYETKNYTFSVSDEDGKTLGKITMPIEVGQDGISTYKWSWPDDPVIREAIREGEWRRLRPKHVCDSKELGSDLVNFVFQSVCPSPKEEK